MKTNINKNFLYSNLAKLVRANKTESIISNLLEIKKLSQTNFKTSKEATEHLTKISEIVNNTISYISNTGFDNTNEQSGYVTISSTVEISEYEIIKKVAEKNNITINKLLSEWLNSVINDPSLLKNVVTDRLPHTGHQFKRIACCIPKHMLDMLDIRLAELKVSRYKCIKIFVDHTVSLYEKINKKNRN